jgi:hypothetical protein
MDRATAIRPSRVARLSWQSVKARIAPSEVALGVVLLAGAALRIWLIHAWRPAFLGYPDAGGYIAAARLSGQGLLFWNAYRPAGYPIFLIAMHGIHAGLTFAIGVQHLMGLVAAVLVYLATIRFTGRRWVALLPAIVITFSGTELYLEHSALSETLYTFLIVAALWCAARSYELTGGRELAWLAAAGFLIGCSTPVRTIGAVLAPVLIGWAAATRRGHAVRLRCAAAVAVAFVIPLGGYLVYQHSKTDTWSITHASGDTLYGRMAIFANCRDFTPPAGTKGLCHSLGPSGGTTDYEFSPISPAAKIFGTPPDPRQGGAYTWPADSKLERFALAALIHQPWAYLWSNVQGMLKYADPNWGTMTMLDVDHTALLQSLQAPAPEAAAEAAAYYPSHPTVHHDVTPLEEYAQAAKVEGPVTVVLVALMLTGFVLARGRRRAGAGLFGWSTVALLVTPVALIGYAARYATPAYGPLAAGAAIGLDALIDRIAASRLAGLRSGRGRRPEARSPASG